MKKIFNTPFTLDELVQEDKKRNEALYKHHARRLCSKADVIPHEDGIVPYFTEECRGSNLEATVHWLKTYMVNQDLIFSELDFAECVAAFLTDLHDRIPPNYWGNEE
jgi:hypothetical protein